MQAILIPVHFILLITLLILLIEILKPEAISVKGLLLLWTDIEDPLLLVLGRWIELRIIKVELDRRSPVLLQILIEHCAILILPELTFLLSFIVILFVILLIHLKEGFVYPLLALSAEAQQAKEYQEEADHASHNSYIRNQLLVIQNTLLFNRILIFDLT